MTEGKNRQQQQRNPALEDAFQLGDWRVDPTLNLITDRHSGEQRHLEPRLMKLLCYLAANNGVVVTRDELVALLWPRVVVNENSLTRAVSELRKRLDAPATPARKAVQTIPKRGYRLTIASSCTSADDNPVEHALRAGAANPDPGLTQARPEPGAHAGLLRAPWRLVTAGIGASLCLLLALGISTRPSTAPTPEALASFSDELVFNSADFTDPRARLSTTGLREAPATDIDQPVLSPDRKRYAFIQRDLAGSSIYLGRMDADYDPVEVFSAPSRLSNLTWSPVGNALLFAHQDELTPAIMFQGSNQGSEEGSELMRLDLDSGTLARMVEDQQPTTEASTPDNNLTFHPPALGTPLFNNPKIPESLTPAPLPRSVPRPTATIPLTPA